MQRSHNIQFISSRIEDMMFRTTLDISSMEGDMIVNLSMINASDLDDALGIIHMAVNSGLSVSPFLKVLYAGETIGGLMIREGDIGIATMCSITIDGVLLKAGIMTNPKLGGVVQIRNGTPVRFTDVLTYASTTIDPLEALMSQDITDVTEMLQTGSGKILANLREVHLSAKDDINSILADMMDVGISGIMEVGEPNTRVLDVPVERDHLGVVVIGGANPMAIMKEQGFDIRTSAMSTLVDINEMSYIEDLV